MGADPKKVLADIEKTGFPSELHVAQRLSERKWYVSNNVYYFDKDESKGREIDVSSYNSVQETNLKPEITVWTNLLIEVKKSKSKPWVIFTSPRGYTEVGGYALLNQMHHVDHRLLSLDQIEGHRPGAKTKRIGRVSCLAFAKGGTSQITDAVLSSTKASIHANEEADGIYRETSYDVVFHTPVVVLDGELFECYLDSKGRLEIHESTHIAFRQNYLSEHYKEDRYHVDIVTMSAFGNYLRAHEKWARSVFDALSAGIRKTD